MFDTNVIRLLEGENIASLATISPRGNPQVSAVWVDFDSDHNILINTALGRQKERNTRSNKKVALSIVNRLNSYETVTISGLVIDRITKNALLHFDKLSQKYLHISKYPLHQARVDRVILKIRPLKVNYTLIPLQVN
ncbi:MAG TPA: pyridoxamine 5'-phosphate oxidase family protein [Candidatus Nitrosocosmicus sp.]|uniref:pyridoxamine 5'-phosphate oxidase family protein n=1 Tax=Candidatus Nitrosocosmicus agrestis TaxID=2563600 RepID=UPI00133151BC|nr:pyridoxamine 5'-phosphate oxidase family protein [Candidatus Nitrosocosmicus sp. SS]MDR4491637.1 pyridoxamine 5'-phosphate oxidase family protein [Candidatus Nitrosocosmicus sp.]HET6589050.1 pyridoxamine 5'-phosphate oxidase family protein [Candidatus Nitrosocosmicus sp.]